MSAPAPHSLATPALRAGPAAAHGARLSVEALEDPRALVALRPAWEELASQALEANPFYEPWMLEPALAGLADGARLVFVLVHAEERGGPRRLVGVFPLERVARYKGLPLGALRLWRHAHCYLCTPLVRRDCARECLEAFFAWFAHYSGASLLELAEVAGEGPFHDALSRQLERHPRLLHVAERHARALFRPRHSAERYLRAALPGRKLREYRRLARRLAEQGGLEYRALGEPARAEHWIRAFLELERGGWKGRAGTALAAAPAERAFFQAIAREAARRGRLSMHGLYLGERAIALSCKIHAGDGAFAFKIAYDEAFEQFSPGVLLELEHIARMHGDARVRWMDSCAVPEHFMANRLWLDRRALSHVVVAAGGAGALVVLLLPLLRRVRRALRRVPPRGNAA